MQESVRIVEIARQYLPLDQVQELFTRLDEEVGKHSGNARLQESLQMMRLLVDPPLPPPRWWMRPALYALVVAHYLLVLVVSMSFFLLPFLTPWYVAAPIMTFVFFFSTTRVECQLTNAENALRRRLGMKRIGAFVSHYILQPVRRLLFRRR